MRRTDGQGVNGSAEQTTALLPEPATDGNKTPPQIDANGPTDEGGVGTDILSDPQTAADNDELPVTFPIISPQDYETDAEFVNMYKYLMTDELTGNARADKATLIMADKYMIQNDLLYRMDLPRQKKLANLRLVTKRLCASRRFRHEIVRYVHNNCGHYAAQSLFHTLAVRYYWKTLFSDAAMYCKTCQLCQRTKINYAHHYVPLHPLPVPEGVGQKFVMDHKILTRTTTKGNTAILVVVESFTGFVHLIPVKDTTTETTAKALINNVIPLWGVGWTLYSDKAPSFMSGLFSQINLSLIHI